MRPLPRLLAAAAFAALPAALLSALPAAAAGTSGTTTATTDTSGSPYSYRSVASGDRVSPAATAAFLSRDAKPAPTSRSRLTPMTAPTAASTTCSPASVTELADRRVLSWTDGTVPNGGDSPTTTFHVLRGDQGSAARTEIATLPATAGQYVDRAYPAKAGSQDTYDVVAEHQDGSRTTADCPVTAERPDRDLLVSVVSHNSGDVPDTIGQADLTGADVDEVVLRRGGQVFGGAYSPDGRKVVHGWAPDATSPVELYVRNANGTGVGQKLTSENSMLVEPKWSPDGRRIVATEVFTDTTGNLRTGLLLVDVATGHVAVIPYSLDRAAAAWLPDGSAVVAVNSANPASGLLRVSLRGGPGVVISGTSRGQEPAVSPDGRTLVFTYTLGGATDPVYLKSVPIGGASPKTLAVSSAAGSVYSPAFSPDGRLYWLEQTDTNYRIDESAVDGTGRVNRDSHLGNGLDTPATLDVRRPVSAGTGDLTGDGKADVVARDGNGYLWVYPGTGRATAPFFGTRRYAGSGWGSFTAVLAPGDLTGDGKADVLARDTSGVLWVYPGNGNITSGSSWGARISAGSGWNGITAFITPGDWDGDGRADLLGRDSYGRLFLYTGNGRGGIATRKQVGSGWNAFRTLTGAGDLTGDGRVDVFASTSDGTGWTYPGNGAGGFLARKAAGSGWNGANAVVGPEDFDGDRQADLMTRDYSGRLWLYPSDDGALSTRTQIGSGWNTFGVVTG